MLIKEETHWIIYYNAMSKTDQLYLKRIPENATDDISISIVVIVTIILISKENGRCRKESIPSSTRDNR